MNGQFANAAMYASGAPSTRMHDGAVGLTGGNEAHENRQPFLTLRWLICAVGIYPNSSTHYYLGTIYPTLTDQPPPGSLLCHGQLLPLEQNRALYALLGVTYGGDGRTNFALPDLRGRVVIGTGHGAALSDYTLGQKGGAATVQLGPPNIPNHNHALFAAGGRGFTWGSYPANNYLSDAQPLYADANARPDALLHVETIGLTGGQNAHNNLMPFLAVNWCIKVEGTWPINS